jgi:hypothetical protein
MKYLPKTQLDALMDDYRHFSESIRKSGHYVNGSQLAPTRAASTVRVRKDIGHRRAVCGDQRAAQRVLLD